MVTVDSDLQAFQERLTGGVAAGARARRPQNWAADDERCLTRGQLADSLAELYRVTDRGGLSPEAVKQRVEALIDTLRRSRDTMIAVLFSPGLLLERAPGLAGRDTPTIVEHWLGLSWMAEAAWLAVDEGLRGRFGYATGDDALLRPLAARLRFLTLSEPMRFRGADTAWLQQAHVPGYGRHGLLERAFGTQTWNGLIGRCSEARRIWCHHLDAYQDHFFLAGAPAEALEQDLTQLVFRAGPGSDPLTLSTDPLTNAATPTPEDTAMIAELTDRHLLPRFDLRSVRRLAHFDVDRRAALHRKVLTWTVWLSATAALAALALSVRLAAALCMAVYALIVAGAVKFDARWAAPWLLRLPATCTVGLLVLVTLPHGWWRQRRGFSPTQWASPAFWEHPTRWLPPGHLIWPVPILLTVTAYGYLVVEGRNHGLSARTSLRRALAVAALGLGHSTLITVVGVVTVLPAFADQGDAFARQWTGSALHLHQAWVLAFAATWCLAVGVFSQILWEDRPITAPLAHLTWRSRR